ncbi:MAG: response regulator [Minisyncoccia bacterium]
MTDTKRILIVEDEEGMALALTDALTQEGYSVSRAADGNAGLAAAQKDHPDLIITDLKMPDMGGLEMIDALRKDQWGKTAKVIILSNASDLESLQKAMEHGTFHYMVKGDSSMADIIATVKKQIEG